jgi:hypothetical protein
MIYLTPDLIIDLIPPDLNSCTITDLTPNLIPEVIPDIIIDMIPAFMSEHIPYMLYLFMFTHYRP